MTVVEALEFCVKKGVDNSQSRLESVIKAKKLSTSQKKTLKEILECYFKNVEIKGGGLKSGRILVSHQYKSPKERITGNLNNGSEPDESIILMREFIFKQLTRIIGDNKSMSLTLRKWYEYIGLYNLIDSDIVALQKELIKHYRNCYESITDQSIKSMSKIVKDGMEERIHYVYGYAFRNLVEAKRIELDYVYKMVLSDEMIERLNDTDAYEKVSSVQVISDKTLENIKKAELAKLDELGFTYKEYEKARYLPRYAKKDVKEKLSEIDILLQEKFGIKYYFRELEVAITDPNIIQDVSKKEARKIFINKTIELITKRTEKSKYVDAETYRLKFFRLNFLLLMRLKGADELDDIINEELFFLKFRIDEIKSKYIEKKIEEEINSAEMLMREIEELNEMYEELSMPFLNISEDDRLFVEDAETSEILYGAL